MMRALARSRSLVVVTSRGVWRPQGRDCCPCVAVCGGKSGPNQKTEYKKARPESTNRQKRLAPTYRCPMHQKEVLPLLGQPRRSSTGIPSHKGKIGSF